MEFYLPVRDNATRYGFPSMRGSENVCSAISHNSLLPVHHISTKISSVSRMQSFRTFPQANVIRHSCAIYRSTLSHAIYIVLMAFSSRNYVQLVALSTLLGEPCKHPLFTVGVPFLCVSFRNLWKPKSMFHRAITYTLFLVSVNVYIFINCREHLFA